METMRHDMRVIFSRLNEENRDILLQIARNMRSMQQMNGQPCEEQVRASLMQC